MKYSIGDRVIVKESGEKGIVVKEVRNNYSDYGVWEQSLGYIEIREDELLTDLTAIEKPFGLLSPEIQNELKAVDVGGNIQVPLGNGDWKNLGKISIWSNAFTYRLSPDYKQEEVKEMTVGEIEAKLGHRVKVVK